MKVNWEGIFCGLFSAGIIGGILYSVFGLSFITVFVSIILFIGGYFKGCESESTTYQIKSKELKNAEHEAYMMGIEHGYYSDEARTARQNADIVRAIENSKK